MLTGKLVRVRYARDRIIPCYIDLGDPAWLPIAQNLIDVCRSATGHTRGQIEDEIREIAGDDPSQLVHQGLAKLLEDRCEFAVVSGHPPAEVRELVFTKAAAKRKDLAAAPADESGPAPTSRPPFNRAAVLEEVAGPLGMTAAAVEQGLFADLKSEQRLSRFKDISPERLLQRYNVALAQAALLRSTRVHVTIRRETPQRYRQLLRLIKFHRLVCDVEALADDSYQFHLDGPLSLFSATQKYGLQLAMFLPAVLLCRDFELRADLNWGAQRKPKTFSLSPQDGLVSHASDTGTYLPVELHMFAELFKKKISTWELSEESGIHPLGKGFWVPDFRLTERASGRTVLLEVLGFWRRASAEKHLDNLRRHAREPFLLAVSDQLHVDDAELDGLPANIHRFRQMPLPDEIARLATELLHGGEAK